MRRWPARLCLVLCLMVFSMGVVFAFRGAANWLDVGTYAERTDYVLPLSGGFDKRPFTAAAMWQEGLTDGILLTRTGVVMPNGLTSQEVNRRVLLHHGVPSDALRILPGRVVSTFDEAVRLRVFMLANPESTVSVVTSGYHTRRTRLIFRRVLGKTMSRVRILSAFTWRYEPKTWWLSSYGFRFVTVELCKYLFYLVRYAFFV